VRVVQREEALKNKSVRFVDGNESKIVDIKVAYARAQEAGLDLVEMSADSDPCVVKMLDYGKIIYEKKKKKKQNHKVPKLKEIKFHANINPHDYGIKLKHIIEFLEKNHSVKITLDYRGREMAHQELGQALLKQLIKDTSEVSKVDSPPETQGRRATMLLSPVKRKKK
jgi:translation initiation factor IF-3